MVKSVYLSFTLASELLRTFNIKARRIGNSLHRMAMSGMGEWGTR